MTLFDSSSPLRDYLTFTLEQYAVKGTFREDHARFMDVANAAKAALSQHPTLQAAAAVQAVQASFGKGNWASTPWMSILDSRETRSTQRGVYLVWLFRADLSGVYLTLAQGVTAVRELHKANAPAVLKAEAERIRGVTGTLQEHGFSSDPIELRSTTYGRDYEASMILQKFYPREALPSEAELWADVDVLMQAYTGYVSSKPSETTPTFETSVTAPAPSLTADLQRALRSRGLSYTDEQAELFFTGLQTKGFVLISGISGTGKSKIAQAFAETFTPPVLEAVQSKVTPSDLAADRSLTLPKGRWPLFGVHADFAPSHATVTLGKVTGSCRLRWTNPRQQLEVVLSGEVWTAFQAQFQVNDPYWLAPIRPADAAHPERPLELQLSATLPTAESRLLFLPVKPDWRDHRPLLGFYNPLTETYVQPPFLSFLLRALEDYEAHEADASPWFVLFDEMNLAHVEHYFADLLSVLESGRDEHGFTSEALQLDVPEGVLPRTRLPLPPNLYVIGTVNLDETTHAFSPKVLDRAFSLEFTDVDFTHYPPAVTVQAEPLEPTTQRIFTRQGRFAQIEKAVIADELAVHPELRGALQTLTTLLRPHLMHFGYRVFDEIVMFHALARGNGMLSAPGEALDAAISLKVLPKFHGGRAKLWEALVKLACWSADPQETSGVLDQLYVTLAGRTLADATLKEVLGALPDDPRAPMSMARALRMLEDLERNGFTAFG